MSWKKANIAGAKAEKIMTFIRTVISLAFGKSKAPKIKAEKIAYIKKYYDARFATLDKALMRRRLINGDITDLQEQFNKLNLEMLAKIKEVQ